MLEGRGLEPELGGRPKARVGQLLPNSGEEPTLCCRCALRIFMTVQCDLRWVAFLHLNVGTPV